MVFLLRKVRLHRNEVIGIAVLGAWLHLSNSDYSTENVRVIVVVLVLVCYEI